MKPVTLLLMALSLTKVSTAQILPSREVLHFYAGTYTDNGSEGIYRFGLDTSSGKLHSNGLAVMSENPSYLALTADGKYLLAVRETVDEKNGLAGYIELFSADANGNLVSVNKVSSGGGHPCHVAVNEDGAVLASNYTGGNVTLMQVEAEGTLSAVLSSDQHTGSGPVAGRQEMAHVHSALFEPGGKRVFVADLGIDKIMVYTIDKPSQTLKRNKIPEIKMAPGSGPRQMAIHPDKKWLFVANELNSSVTVVQLLENGNFKVVETVSALPADFKDPNTCADIHLSPDGKFLYVSNRGMNSIAIFSVDPSHGKLQPVGYEGTKGETPRNFTLTPGGEYLLVANQNTDNIVAFKRDEATGLLTFSDQINANKPVCLLFK